MTYEYISRNLRQFERKEHGQVGVWFALLALPLLSITTFALDLTSATREKSRLSSALDTAALASVSQQNIDDVARGELAQKYFWENIGENDNIVLSVNESSAERVALQATSLVPTTINAALGVKNLSVTDTSAAEVTSGEVICLLVLDPTGANSFEVTTGANLQAPTCSVQVNSTHARAAVVNHGAVASAKGFCVSGGVEGTFLPHVNTECRNVADPYEALTAPAPGACIDDEQLQARLNHYTAQVWPGITLTPGTYCGNLILASNHVKFAPGTYIIKDGAFVISDGSWVNAQDGVTFVLHGKSSYFRMGAGSTAAFKAPSEGPLAGLVFFQDTAAPDAMVGPLPNATSEIVDASGFSMVGTGYFPTQKVVITRGSLSSGQAPATAFIAHQISLQEAAQIGLEVEHQGEGLPPILPRSDDSVRLTE